VDQSPEHSAVSGLALYWFVAVSGVKSYTYHCELQQIIKGKGQGINKLTDSECGMLMTSIGHQ